LEYILLGLCLCVIALRATFTEGPGAQSSSQPLNLGDRLYSLSVSGVLIFAFAIWVLWGFCSKRFLYRFTAIEAGLCMFVVAGILAGFAAPDRRAAITGFVILLAPVLMAILLVQILDSPAKIKLVLAVIAALGVTSAYQCAYQFFVTNQMEIRQYEEAPETRLTALGIRPDTLAHWQFEHRLYSRGVNGFFTTSNSAGSFSLLAAFAAIALFVNKLKRGKSGELGRGRILAAGAAVVIVIFGLGITRSKGALVASVIAAAMFAAYLLFAERLKAHKTATVIVCLGMCIAAGCAVILYGASHGRLPGGNSMLVRWQYWQASARMYADHLLTGVGPGNFVYFYFRYKVPAALETVSDPHNFLLAVVTQYGPVGLTGLLVMIFIPLSRALSRGSTGSLPKTDHFEPSFSKLAGIFAVVISAALLVIRPIVMADDIGETLDVMIYVTFVLYFAPVVTFAIGLWLVAGREKTAPAAFNVIAASVFCAVIGFLIHNLIDFAIFEPGVLTAFWAIMACLVASDFEEKSRQPVIIEPSRWAGVIGVVGTAALVWGYANYAFIPVAKTTARTRQALQNAEYAHGFLSRAAEDDPLDGAALNLNGGLYLQEYEQMGKKQPVLLEQAAECFVAAIERNKADFKNFERLTEVYTLLAEASPPEKKTNYLNKAFDSSSRAVELYPGSGRLHFQLAQIAEQLSKTDMSVREYKESIEIEDSYRGQFRLMYPGQKVFSRLGEEKYQYARQRIRELSEQPIP